MYPEQVNIIEAQEGRNIENMYVAVDRGLPTNDGNEGEKLSSYFDNCDDVMNSVTRDSERQTMCEITLRLYLAFVFSCGSISKLVTSIVRGDSIIE